ncbi:MAG TPA: phosphate signaling complex protein PhoU, partial [Polyangiaceae bacterium]|nr:phosphate signaling complex protein PhoU [Polyangiaceae bacterium]
ALKAYADLDYAIADQVVNSDFDIDRLELEIDDACLQLLARRQPVASDLRFVTMTLKVVTDLERIGDLSTNICERVLEFEGTAAAIRPKIVVEMGESARDMLHDAMDALVAGDVRKAQEIVGRDREIDEKYASLFPVIAQQMCAEPSVVDQLMRTLSVAKYLERVADHATNLAEMVVFMVEGRDVRHLDAGDGPVLRKARLN